MSDRKLTFTQLEPNADKLSQQKSMLEADIKNEVLSVYAAAHPEIQVFRSESSASVSVRNV